ncbi:OTU domain-containing protein [Cucumis melo var. makuwa]|uniref:Ubiquitin thioesterase OTU n=1 Tax=Cucumis melo var. makuwa TaxID=1194695 RepID=A0A5A7SN70_CUCMM|nr:OTU domain-containing protein [Cucumis melo var. makuwa]
MIHYHERKGEGSWNVDWDARPAHWLYHPDSAWLLFGVCACIAPLDWVDASHEVVSLDQKKEVCESSDSEFNQNDESSTDYRVTGVLADGRCLFRAIAHGACLRSGEEAPDDDRQRELADELRAKARLEFMHNHPFVGDFDVYVMRIQQPFVWGGEPELLMVSHVLKQVFIYIASHNFVS